MRVDRGAQDVLGAGPWLLDARAHRPAAVTMARARWRAGILIRSAEALETARKLDTIVLDKTGTVTEGRPVLTDVEPVGGFGEDELLALAAGAESDSEHPLARAVVEGAPRPNAATARAEAPSRPSAQLRAGSFSRTNA
ncbi:HAD family hydrolase [Streptomyces vietnamensis]|uniref:HAD family hydrolase n=1 Tax=Streptomyces vietnamensis TaxID=362257 RepID=UPI003412DC7C